MTEPTPTKEQCLTDAAEVLAAITIRMAYDEAATRARESARVCARGEHRRNEVRVDGMR